MSLSFEKFEAGCQRLYGQIKPLESATFGIDLDYAQQRLTFRVVKTPTIAAALSIVASNPTEPEVVDEDDERLDHCPNLQKVSNIELQDQVTVCYSIHHSTGYQVPVLYIDRCCNPSMRQPFDIEQMVELLVPETSRDPLSRSAPLGMLTLTDPPSGGPPAFMVHPCRTQDMMHDLQAGKGVSPARYLVIWLGAVGPSVGLNLPLNVQHQLRDHLDDEDMPDV